MSFLGKLFGRTPKNKIDKLERELANDRRTLEVLWKFENRGGYVLGSRPEILKLEGKIAEKEAELAQLKRNLLLKEGW